MYFRSLSVISVFAALVLLSGCQSPGLSRHAATVPPLRHDLPAPAYYYYLSAQMTLKKGDVNQAVWLMEKAMENDPGSLFLKLETANLMLLIKQQDKALNLLNRILASDPDHVQALALAGRILQQQDNTSAAKVLLEKAVAGGTQEQNSYLLLGRIYWNEKDWDNALRVFAIQVKRFPDSYAAHYFLGRVQAVQHKWEAAERSMLRSLELESALEEPRLELLKIYQAQNRPAMVSRTYRDILAENPENNSAVIDFALHYGQIRRPGEANRLLSDLGRRSLTDESIVTLIYERFLQNKQYETAEWVLDGLLQGAPEHSDLHYLAGIACDGLKRRTSALQHFRKVTGGSRFHDSAVVHSALLYHDSGKIDLAIATLEKAVQGKPENADFYFYLSTFYEDIERYGDALETLERGLAVDDRNLKLHFRRGVIFDKMGRKPDSIAAMKTVLALKPDDAEALNYLGYTYADLGINLDEAEKLIQAALKIKPEDGYITDSLGWVYYKRGQYVQALDYLSRAAKLVPDDPTILEHLGDVHTKLNSPAKALNFYRRSMENNPKGKKAIEEKIQDLKQ